MKTVRRLPMPPARLVVLGISLAAGISAAVLASGSKPPEIVAAKGPATTIVVAAGPLEYGTTLTDDNVSEAPWESSIVPEGAFTTKADLLKDGARATLTSMKRNEPILSSRITGPNQPASLAALTEPGMRVVSVRVDEARGVAGFVRMGDRVDVILTRSDSKNEPSSFHADVLLQDVKVLATGQIANDRQEHPTEGTDRDRRGFDRAGAKAHSCRERGNTVACAAASRQSGSRGRPAHNLGGYWRI
jgi:pilus assembly protein CpaB